MKPKCGACKERPDITKEGEFYCPVICEHVSDKDYSCEYFEHWRR